MILKRNALKNSSYIGHLNYLEQVVQPVFIDRGTIMHNRDFFVHLFQTIPVHKRYSVLLSELARKDNYNTLLHSQRVVVHALNLADTLKFTENEKSILVNSILFHDIGKLLIPKEVLLKSTNLSQDEWELIRQHPTLGYEIVNKFLAFDKIIPEVVLNHHENEDGTGYPNGIGGQKLSKYTKIVRLVDSYDAMTADRPYRKGLSAEEAKQELIRYSGKHFDERLVEMFIQIVS
jgi:HD-GYP domain-containing protein (c-di-GMP phosphodiesterase class II)